MKQSLRERFKKYICNHCENKDCRFILNYDKTCYSAYLETLIKEERSRAERIVVEYLKELSPVKNRNRFEKGVAFGMNYLKTRLELKGE